MSWFYDELNGVNKHGIDVPRQTRNMFDWLKSGGTFVLQIKTDFLGNRPLEEIHDNRFNDYVNLFSPLGEIISITDWFGRKLGSEFGAQPTVLRKIFKKLRWGIVIVTQKG